jgi:hypothetical protein
MNSNIGYAVDWLLVVFVNKRFNILPPSLPLSVSGSHTFSGLTFFFNSVWFAGIYVRGCIRKLFLVRAIMKVAKSTVEDVRFTFTMTVCSVLVAVWHYECHRLIKGIKIG